MSRGQIFAERRLGEAAAGREPIAFTVASVAMKASSQPAIQPNAGRPWVSMPLPFEQERRDAEEGQLADDQQR